MRVKLPLKQYKCKCGGYAMSFERCKYQSKYKLYCGACLKFICFAKSEDKPLIMAREIWVEEHNK